MSTSQDHSPKAAEVTGSGGRRRTVYVCAFGCWHSSYGQAVKCKNAAAKIAREAGR